MREVLDVPDALVPVSQTLAHTLTRVAKRFDDHLASELPPLDALLHHIERYRGKMLRPSLVALSGLAADPSLEEPTDAHVALGAVVEMVHMATLVHDDILDEAEVRRRGQTVNSMSGNETAVILGDYLIAGAYHLCSLVDHDLPGTRASVIVGDASMRLCAGELLQIHHRGDWSLDEATYREIVLRKTGSLLGVSAALGAAASGADEDTRAIFRTFGELAGIAFQIQDDLLDLTGDESVVGKSVRRDLGKGKLTLPLVHALAAAEPEQRGRMLRLIAAVAQAETEGRTTDPASDQMVAELLTEMRALGSIDHARNAASALIGDAKSRLSPLPDSPAKELLAVATDAMVARRF